jgi:hypothetical protein
MQNREFFRFSNSQGDLTINESYYCFEVFRGGNGLPRLKV